MKEWMPAARAEVVRLAVPPDRDTVPRVVPPSEKMTLPVGAGIPPPLAVVVTVAVSVKGCPKTGVVVEGATVTDVVAPVTVR